MPIMFSQFYAVVSAPHWQTHLGFIVVLLHNELPQTCWPKGGLPYDLQFPCISISGAGLLGPLQRVIPDPCRGVG